MRAMVSLVRSWLVGIGVFIAMTLSICVAFTIAIAGPPTKSELADLRALVAETMRAIGQALQQGREDAPVEHAEAQPPPEPAPPAPPPAGDRAAPPVIDNSPLLGGPSESDAGAPPGIETQSAEPLTTAPRAEPRRPRAQPPRPAQTRRAQRPAPRRAATVQQAERRAAPAGPRAETPAARPPPAIDSRAAQIARAAEELLATLPPAPDKDDAAETEASAPADELIAPPEKEQGETQSYEDWAESWTPFEHDHPADAFEDEPDGQQEQP